MTNIMARSLSSALLKGFAALPSARLSTTLGSASFYQHGMRFSTTVPNDPDTHEDFRPSNKLDSSDLSLKDIVEQDIKDNPVMIYMKGVPELPRCGFSSLAVRVLKEYDVPLSARNILENPELKEAVKSVRREEKLERFPIFALNAVINTQVVLHTTGTSIDNLWPTFPQIFIKGEFIGGSDIILTMHQSGELMHKLKDGEDANKKSE